ncbi:MAG TPA: purine-nucleoside phosphorylase, partial [Nocardioidaceae bacterium]|nr:purine-nucleoside phosphorylase [Nocardioidaceae bacterium]
MDAATRDRTDEAAAAVAELTGVPRHDALVVLGSGWSPAAEALGEPVAAFPMVAVPGFLAPVAEGHRGEIRSYDVRGVRVLAYLGRTHL